MISGNHLIALAISFCSFTFSCLGADITDSERRKIEQLFEYFDTLDSFKVEYNVEMPQAGLKFRIEHEHAKGRHYLENSTRTDKVSLKFQKQ